MNYKKVTFSIICDDEKHLEEILNWYNKTYNTDFRIENIIYFNRYFRYRLSFWSRNTKT